MFSVFIYGGYLKKEKEKKKAMGLLLKMILFSASIYGGYRKKPREKTFGRLQMTMDFVTIRWKRSQKWKL